MTWTPPSTLSPSKMSTFLQCPMRFRVEYIQHFRDPPGAPALAGTTVHSAMEDLMRLDPGERTLERVEEFAEVRLAEMKESDDYKLLTDEQLKGFDAKVRRASRRVFEVIDPTAVKVEGLELRLEVGFEDWRLVGIIDLLEVVGDGLGVRDWKAGRAPSERFQAKALLGLNVYAVMVKLYYGEIPDFAQLVYLDDRVLITREQNERSIRATEGKIRAIAQAIDRACENDSFACSTGPLCNYCSVKPFCPEWGGSLDDIPVPVNVRS